MTNPLLAPWTGPFGLPPFAEVRAEHFAPAFAEAMRSHLAEIDAIAAAAQAVRPDVIVLCHGGPIAMPDDAAYVLAKARTCHGFYGASSMERLPVETAIASQTRAFKALPMPDSAKGKT